MIEKSSHDFLLTLLLVDIQNIEDATTPNANPITRTLVMTKETRKAEENTTEVFTSKTFSDSFLGFIESANLKDPFSIGRDRCPLDIHQTPKPRAFPFLYEDFRCDRLVQQLQ